MKKNPAKKIDRLVEQMLVVLAATGIPVEKEHARMRRRIAEAALAVTGVSKCFADALSSDDGRFLTTRQIIAFENEKFGGNYSPGSYDDVRRRHLILLTAASYIVSSSSLASQSTNNPTRGYAASPDFAALLRSYGTPDWGESLANFMARRESLRSELERKREMERIPVVLPSGVEVMLSSGEHNALQRDIVQEFLPRFGFGAEVLYLGDATDKYLVRESERLSALGFFVLEHDELPDVIAYSAKKNMLFLIEAVHSSGEMSELRVRKLKGKLSKCKATIVFVSAFATRKVFRKFSANLAWESEAWISDTPDHMIHFNGWKFLELQNRSYAKCCQ